MKKIFLIDDDADDREVFRTALESLAVQSLFSEAENGEVALQMLQSEVLEIPDFIFLDLNMPIMGGFEFLKNVRLIPEYKDVSILIYSTSSLQKDKNLATTLGANGFITKHYSFDALCNELKILFLVE